MQKRIARARAEGERIGRQTAAEETAALQRELAETRRKVHGIEVGGKVSAAEAKHVQEMKALEVALEQAHKDGNFAESAKLQTEMNRKEVAWLETKRTLLATPVEESRKPSAAPKGPAPEGRAWMAANADWYNKPGFEAETAATIAIDEKLLAEGSDPNSPAHYKQIQKELTRKFRDLEVLDPDGNPLERKKSRRQEREDSRVDEEGRRRTNDAREELPLEDPDDEEDEDDDDQPRRGRGDDDDDDDDDRRGRDDDDEDDEDDDEEQDDARRSRKKPGFMNVEDSGGGGGGRRSPIQRRGGKVVLSRQDRSDMVKFGMDPDNDKHVESYARTIAEEGQD